MATKPQTLAFHVSWYGEPDAGVLGGFDEVTIRFRYGWAGGPDTDVIEYFRESLKEFYDGATVVTDEELKKEIAAENAVFGNPED